MKRNDRDEGFTLIELLIVMVIIGLLAAIAIPSFLSQRGKAYRSAMKSDLHALIVSEEAYNTGNDAFTNDTTLLQNEGYIRSSGVTAHVKVLGATFLACTKHTNSPDWLVFDSGTRVTTSSPADCA